MIRWALYTPSNEEAIIVTLQAESADLVPCCTLIQVDTLHFSSTWENFCIPLWNITNNRFLCSKFWDGNCNSFKFVLLLILELCVAKFICTRKSGLLNDGKCFLCLLGIQLRFNPPMCIRSLQFICEWVPNIWCISPMHGIDIFHSTA